jgi:hypothetical protein
VLWSCSRSLQDESRHMGVGMLALLAIVETANDAERCEMEDFTCLASLALSIASSV